MQKSRSSSSGFARQQYLQTNIINKNNPYKACTFNKQTQSQMKVSFVYGKIWVSHAPNWVAISFGKVSTFDPAISIIFCRTFVGVFLTSATYSGHSSCIAPPISRAFNQSFWTMRIWLREATVLVLIKRHFIAFYHGASAFYCVTNEKKKKISTTKCCSIAVNYLVDKFTCRVCLLFIYSVRCCVVNRWGKVEWHANFT